MHVFPSRGKNSHFRVISGYYSLVKPFSISAPKMYGTWQLPCNLWCPSRGDLWVSAGKPGGMKSICLCKFADRGVARQNFTRLIFETSRGPVCISTQNSQLIPAPPWNSPLRCLRRGIEALRFWFEPAPRLSAYRSFPGSLRPSTAWLSRSIASILFDRLPRTRQRDQRFGEQIRPASTPF